MQPVVIRHKEDSDSKQHSDTAAPDGAVSTANRDQFKLPCDLDQVDWWHLAEVAVPL